MIKTLKHLRFMLVMLLATLGVNVAFGAEVKLVSVGMSATQTSPTYLDDGTVYKSADESYSVTISSNAVTKVQGGSYNPGTGNVKDYYYYLGSNCDLSADAIANYLALTANGCKISKVIVRAHCNNTSQAILPAIAFEGVAPAKKQIGTKYGREVSAAIKDQTPGSYGSVKRFDNATNLTFNFGDGVGSVYFSKQFKQVQEPGQSSFTAGIPASSAQAQCVYGIEVYVIPNTPVGPVDPTATFSGTNYEIDGTLDLATLFDSNSDGAVTYTVKDAGTTGATISGSNFTATAAGTAVVTASQAATASYNAATVDATITVTAASVKSAIVYANTKTASIAALPTEYSEGVGIASFAALADVTGFHFTGWNPSSISASATGEQTITAEWEEIILPCATMGPITSSVAVGSAPVSGLTLSDASVSGKTVDANGNGLKLGGNDSRLKVTLNDATIVEGTKIVIKYKNPSANSGIGVFNGDYAHQVINLTGVSATGSVEHTFTAAEAANYSDAFIITRNGTGASNYINAIEVYGCGAAAVKRHVTYAKGDAAVTGTLPTQADVKENGTFTVAGKGDLAWTGHTFTGWNDGAADYAAGATYTMGTTDVTLTAQWEEINCSAFQVTCTNGQLDPFEEWLSYTKEQGATTDIFTFNLTAVTGGTAATYEWYRNTVDEHEGENLVRWNPDGDTEFHSQYSKLPDVSTPGTYYYFCKVTSTDGCEAYSKTITYVVNPVLSSKKQLTRVKFSNNFDAFVKESDHSVTAYYMGETAPTVAADSWVVSEKATAAVVDNKIVVTAEDGTTQDYAITLTQVTPAAAGEYTFDGTESWVKTGYTYSSTRGWRMSQSLDEPAANKMRIAEGWNRVNFFVAACENITLYTASGISSDRAIEVYRNGVKLAGEGIPTTAPKYNANGTAKITIPGDIQNPSYITIVNKGSGDGGFGKAEIKEYIKSTDATLSNLTVNGGTVEGFDAATLTYNVELPFGTVDVPTVEATKNDDKAQSVVVTAATELPGATTVVVTAEDGTTTQTYTINFTVLTTHYVAKIGETKYESLADAIAAVPTNGTPTVITLIDNTTENVVVPAGANIVLNMGNFTLSGGSVATNGNKAAIVNNGTIVVNGDGATIKREDDDTERTTSSSYYVIDNQGTMTINAGVTVTNNSGVNEGHKGSSLIRNGEVSANASLTIDGATLVQPNFNVIKDGGNGSVLVIKSGTIGTDGQLNYAVLSYGNVTVEGGVVNGPLCFRSYDADACDATIKGGTINGNITVETYPGNTPDALSSLTITDGATVNGTIATGIGNGSTFTSDADAEEHGEVAISGGVFSNPVAEAYCAEGFGPKANGDGTYGVKVVHTFWKWDGESINFEKKNAADELEFTVYSTNTGGRQNGTTALNTAQRIDRTDATAVANVLQASQFVIKFEKEVKQVKLYAYNGNTGRNLSSVQVTDADNIDDTPSWSNAGFTLTTNTLATNYDYEYVIDGHFEAGKYYFIKTSSSVSFFDILYTEAVLESESASIVAGTIDGVDMTAEQLAELNGAEHTLTLAGAVSIAPEVVFNYKHTATYDDEFVKTLVDATETAVEATVGTTYEMSKAFEGVTYKVVANIDYTPALELDVTEGTAAIAGKNEANRKTDFTVTLTGANLTAGEYNVNVPVVEGLTVTPMTFTVGADNKVAETFVITYKSSVDVAEALANIEFTANTLVGEPATKTATFALTYSSVAWVEPAEVVKVSEATTWDWNGLASETISMPDGDDFIILSTADGVPAGFNAATLASKKGSTHYLFRNTTYQCWQGGAIKFETTVPGFVTYTLVNPSKGTTINFNLNGEHVYAITAPSGSASSKQTISLFVPAGEVVLALEEAGKDMRVYKIGFEPTALIRTTTPGKLITMCQAQSVTKMDGAVAYEVEKKNPIGIDLVEAELPLVAGKPYILEVTKGDVNVVLAGDAETAVKPANGLIGNLSTATENLPIENFSESTQNYVFQNNHLMRANNNYAQPDRAYLNYDAVQDMTVQDDPEGAPRRRISMGGASTNTTTGIDAIQMTEETQKIMVEGQLYIIRGGRMYNVNGVLVK